MFERAKIFRALNRAATVTGFLDILFNAARLTELSKHIEAGKLVPRGTKYVVGEKRYRPTYQNYSEPEQL
jgi:hypothetical protein